MARNNTISSEGCSDKQILRPEELVRRENKAVNILRALLISVLIVVGTVLSYESYRLESKWEVDTYQREFKAVASKITDEFKNSMTDIMWTAYIFGAAISASSDLVKAAPNITISNFDQFGKGAVQKFRMPAVHWAPLIRNEKQREEWEAYAQDQINANETKDGPVCFPCGEENQTISPSDRYNGVSFPTGTYTCSDLEYFGLTGVIPENYCSLLVSYVRANCGCRQATPEEVESKKVRAKPRSNRIYTTTDSEVFGNITVNVEGPGPYAPIWQVYPSNLWASAALYDVLSDLYVRGAMKAMLYTEKTIFSQISRGLFSSMVSPVFHNSDIDGNKVIGAIAFIINWATFFESIVPFRSNGIHILLENSCGQKRTFKSLGANVVLVGEGDFHEPGYSSMVDQTTFDDFFTSQTTASSFQNEKESKLNCAFKIAVYSTEEFKSNYITHKPQLYATVVALIFAFTGILFITYDCYVARRQRKVMNAVLQRDDIVSNLFPAAVRERLFNARQTSPALSAPRLSRFGKTTIASVTKIFRVHHQQQGAVLLSNVQNSPIGNDTTIRSEPIADFFPNVTIVFADISGFTAWSSEREPSQVFQLLETVYQAFDQIAHKHGVFKIETIGDCYVAVAGIPVFQPDHAVRIVRFAYECLLHMHELTHELESTLGPSTSGLTLRVGVHSGPVTAGVLRGEKCRFQLFGDTVNTTSRMQTTGENSRIQVSSATAKLLEDADKSSWLQQRTGEVSIKGKGQEVTYWVNPMVTPDGSDVDQNEPSDNMSASLASKDWGDPHLTSSSTHNTTKHTKLTKGKTQRLVEWNADLLWRLLKKVVVSRRQNKKWRPLSKYSKALHAETTITPTDPNKTTRPLDEITDIISMHEFSAIDDVDPNSITDLDEAIRLQLVDYVSVIASMYHDNPFHNFEHASHVAMSASKVVMRIIRPDVQQQEATTNLAHRKGRLAFKKKIHDSTFGISSDVLMQFAAVFSAVIHDVDHVGVSNAQLVKERHELSVRYNGKCVAEQNSVDIALDLLLKPQYSDLLACICPDKAELDRFHQLLVNAVIATDIADKELQQKRKKRWDKAFHCGSESTEAAAEASPDAKIDMDRKATIVFEYIIQASDVAHTMQHWKVYLEWNERLFEERYKAYLCGREEQDPCVGWYKGEIWFFDNYIIPLAKKLETCGVFGVSSDEYLSYALENRHEWELRGEEIVKNMKKKFGKVDGLLVDGIQEEFVEETNEPCSAASSSSSPQYLSSRPGRRHSAFA